MEEQELGPPSLKPSIRSVYAKVDQSYCTRVPFVLDELMTLTKKVDWEVLVVDQLEEALMLAEHRTLPVRMMAEQERTLIEQAWVVELVGLR